MHTVSASISANHHQLFVVKKQFSRTVRRLLWLCIRPVVLRINHAPRTKPTLSPQWLPRSVVGQRRVLGPERETVPAASRGVAMGGRSSGALLEEAEGPRRLSPEFTYTAGWRYVRPVRLSPSGG